MVDRPKSAWLDLLGARKLHALRAHSKIRALFKAVRRHMNRGESLRFLGRLIQPGDLVFDVGANMGEKTELYLTLGAKVVAIEPQERCVLGLRRRFGNNPRVTIVPVALGADEGKSKIRISDIRSPLSSMSDRWIDAVQSSGRFTHYGWSETAEVPVITLDSCIELHGEPAFCKIDVEGYEIEVLSGLSQPLKGLSFEFHIELVDVAFACLEKLGTLGQYRFNYTVADRTLWELPRWATAEELKSALESLPYTTLQGDVYGRCLSA